MKLRSFRVRIALIAALLAGGALVGFGATSWWLIYNAKVSRLDEMLKSQLLRASRPPRQRQTHAAPLSRMLSNETGAATALWVTDASGNTLHQSSNWPADLQVLWPARPQFAPLGKSHPPSESQISVRLRPAERFPRRVLPEPQFTTQSTATETWRVGATTSPYSQVAIAVSLNAVDREMATIRNAFLLLIAIALLLIAVAAWLLSGSALRPIQQLTTVIRQVTVKGLDQRVPVGTTDVEFVQLIQVFNQMLENLERSFKQASRFSADAAHELKTPLAILQGELERTLQQVETGSEVQQRLSSLLDEVRRLSGITRKLLLLSLADAGQMSLHRVDVNLSEILVQIEEDVELLAPDLEVQTDVAPNLWVEGDRDLLVQVIQNLISNAIKYNLPDGWIKLQARHQQTAVRVTITNASKTIPPSDGLRPAGGHRDHIFDRFHRGDPARTRRVEGTGLGLSLSREIARAHHGDLTLDPTPAGQSAFTLTLPARRT